MKVFDLSCSQDHRFEGWFDSEAEYDRQLQRALVECPVCACRDIKRLPSAPRLNLSQSGGDSKSTAEPSEKASAQLQAMWLQMARQILETTEDVGDRFAEEARRIHYRETEERAIRGIASAEQTAELADEGIEVFSMPLPVIAKGPIQ